MRKDLVFAWSVAGLLFASTIAGAADLRLAAVDVNGSPVVPATTTLNVVPGDVVTAHLLLKNFGAQFPTGVRSFQAFLNGIVGVVSGGNSRVVPVGWDAPLSPIICTVNSECPIGMTCQTGTCKGALHSPGSFARIDTTNPRYLHLNGTNLIQFVSTGTLNYAYTSTIDGARVDDGGEFYVGTLVLEVRDFACGQFTFGFDPVQTLLGDITNQITLSPNTTPLVLNAGVCPPLADFEYNCVVDAGLPQDPGTGAVITPDSYILNYDQSPASLNADSFFASASPFVPFNELQPDVSSFIVNGNTGEVVFNQQLRVDTARWWCARQVNSGRSYCTAVLPGDVDGNKTTHVDDIDALIDYLIPPAIELKLPSCDINRSGACTPQDLLSEIDIFNLAGALNKVWEGVTLTQPCPGRPLP